MKPKLKSNSEKVKKNGFNFDLNLTLADMCVVAALSAAAERSLPIHLLHILHFISNKWAPNVKKGRTM